METKNLIIRNVPDSLHHDLKVKAAQEKKTIQALIIELIAAYVYKK